MIEYSDVESQHHTPEIYVMLLTRVTSVHLIKRKNKQTNRSCYPKLSFLVGKIGLVV